MATLVFEVDVFVADHVVQVGEEDINIKVVILVHALVQGLDALLQLVLLDL